jgi:hypothetical protein
MGPAGDVTLFLEPTLAVHETPKGLLQQERGNMYSVTAAAAAATLSTM